MNAQHLIILIKKIAGISDSGYGSLDDDDMRELTKDMPHRDWRNEANFGFEKEGRMFTTPQEYINWKKQQKGGDAHVEFDHELERVNDEMNKDKKGAITSLEQLKAALMDIVRRIDYAV